MIGGQARRAVVGDFRDDMGDPSGLAATPPSQFGQDVASALTVAPRVSPPETVTVAVTNAASTHSIQ
jgi:hypothetical protein